MKTIQKIRKVKGIIALCLMIGLAASLGGPGITVAGTANITSGLDLVQGGGSAPQIKAKWEMYKGTPGEDEKDTPGAQFKAPGIWGEKMEYTVCAVVTDLNGVDDISEVNARIYYPDDRPMHKYNYDPSTGAYEQLEDPDFPSIGCGSFIEKNTLVALEESAGHDLLCDAIRTNNYDLPEYNAGYGFTSLADMYNDICGVEGQLKKGTAKVYCDDKYLIWEDPAGDYRVDVTAVDNGGLVSEGDDALSNTFQYLENTVFEVDFSNVDYGQVLYNTHQIVAGDKTFQVGDGKPTIRNTGNVRLNIKVAQDDMGLCTDAGLTHVKYDARVGTGDYRYYYPFKYKEDSCPGTPPTSGQYKPLLEVLDLSEIEEMDFSIKLLNWPVDGAISYTGYVWLSASKANFGPCL